MINLNPTTQFKKDYKKCIARNYKIELLADILDKLINNIEIPPKNKPHLLKGNYKNHWECHIQPDWLLIWYIEDENNITLTRTGTHSDLF